MKTKIILGALTLWSSVSFAQTNRSANYVTPENLQVKLDHFYSSVYTGQITSGVLMDKSAGVVSPDVFNGTNLAPAANVNDWYALYQQVSGARINSSWSLPTPQTLFDKIDIQKTEDRIPLGILFANYHQIKNGAEATEGWFTVYNDKLTDVPGRVQNPYEQKMLAIATPFRADYEDGNVTFIVPADLVLTNRGSFSLQIDFDDGNGFKTVAVNTPVSVNYTTEGVKNLVFKVTQSGISYYAKTLFTVKNVFTFDNSLGKNCMGACFDALWKDVDQQTADPITSSEAYIIYANGRSYIQQPFIFVEGQDLDEIYNFKELFFALCDGRPTQSNTPLNQIISNGYDVIMLNFKNRSTESMRNNSEVLRRLLKWVNQNKQGTDKLTLSGVSMGGVIARYTLTKMESVYCEDHNVEKYLSLDAPHTGANVPLGLQILTRNAYALSFGFSYDMARNNSQINAPSTMELLSSHAWGNGGRTPLGVSFYNELKRLGMPQKCRNVAWGNGNTFNNIPAPTDLSVAFNQGDEILGYSRTPDPNANTQLTVQIGVNAVNASALSSVLNLRVKYRVKIDFPWYVFTPDVDWTPIDMDDHYPFQTDKPYDNSPGGYIFTQQTVADGLSGSTTHGRNHHCIVPTMSAFGIETNALFYNQTFENIDLSRVSPFDAVYASSNAVNYGHKILPPDLGTQLMAEMLTPPVLRNSLLTLQNQTYNVSSSSSLQKIPGINISSGGVLLINGGMGSDYGTGAIPPAGSSLVVNSSECASTVHIRAGGVLKIGDGARYATVNIGVGSSVVIHNGGLLDIRYGSKLVLAGGSLVFEEGAAINLQDLESIVEIKEGGKILIDVNAKFSWAGAGFLRVNTSTKGVANIMATASGNNAKFEQRGNISRKAIEVTNGSLSVDKNLAGFTLISGIVLMGENTMFDVAAPMFLGNIKMDILTPGTRFSGIWVYGQQSTSYMNNCVVDNADIGLRIFGSKGPANKAVLYNTNFNSCNIGILAYGKAVEVDGGKFWGNKTGIFLSGAQFASQVSNVESRNNRSAIDVVGSGSDVLNLKGVNFYNNSAVGAFIVNSKVIPTCSKIFDNYAPSNPTGGSNILLREYAVLDIEPFGPKDGGRNMFSNASSPAVVCVGAKGFMLNKGLSDFTTPTSAFSITGTLDKWPGSAPRPVILATENYWGSPLGAPFNGIDYLVQYQTPFGATTLTIDGSNPLVSNSTLQSCSAVPGGGGTYNWDDPNRSSLFYNKTNLYLTDGTSIEQRLMMGIEKLHGSNPDYPSALDAFLSIIGHPFGTAKTIGRYSEELPSEFEQWYDVVDFSYTKAMEAAGAHIQNGGAGEDVVGPLTTAMNILKATYRVVGNGEDRLFEINLDEALLYRLADQRNEALSKINIMLANVDNSEMEIRLLNYYQCLISKEINMETSEDKLEYASIDECRAMLGMDEGDVEIAGDRPADPEWAESMGKRGSTTPEPQQVKELVKEQHWNEDLAANIKVYPNPATDLVYIQLPHSMQADEINIIDMAGRVVATQKQLSLSGNITLPLELRNGIYYVEVKQGDYVLARKKMMVVHK